MKVLRNESLQSPRFTGIHLRDPTYADVAQLDEHLICNQKVEGSSPFVSSPGELPEWSKGVDCKSAGLCLRSFESNIHHVLSALIVVW